MLDQTLKQFKLLRIPAGVEWELIVVNNASTDDTDDVISRHASELPIHSIVESKQGHCHARNCAIDHTNGQWMLWD